MRKYFKYGLMLIVVILLWDAVLIQPLKVFASYIHQIGHLLMALIFSYVLGVDFQVSLVGTGYKIINQKSGISAFFIGNAGYLSSMLFAFLLLYFKDTPSKKYVINVVALFFIIFAGAYSGMPLHLLYAAIFAAIAIIIHILHKDHIYEIVLEFIAISNIAYTLYDLLFNTIYYELNIYFRFAKWSAMIPYSDTMQLHTLTRVPSLVWGVLWFFGIVFVCLVKFKTTSSATASEEASK